MGGVGADIPVLLARDVLFRVSWGRHDGSVKRSVKRGGNVLRNVLKNTP